MVVASVFIWKQFAGAVLWDDAQQLGIFEYDSSFLNSGLDLAPLMLPLNTAKRGNQIFSFPGLPAETYHGLPGFLADALPDRFGNQLIDAWLASQGRSAASMNPVERLCYMGKRAMGALEFEPATGNKGTRSIPLELDELVNLAKQAVEQKAGLETSFTPEDSQDAMEDILKVGTSAGGARAKAVIAFNEKTGEVRSGQLNVPKGFSHWLLKLDGVNQTHLGDPLGYGRIEYAYYKMALAGGVSMSECRLKEENGRAHFMTRRFDRTADNEKIHMQTLCGMAHFDYNNPLAYSYEQAFQVMRELRLPYPDAVQLFTRMVFNVVSRNQDDHTKNISFLMDEQGSWRLAPAYDVTYAFDLSNRWLMRHQMSVNGKRENINERDLEEVAFQMNVKKPLIIIQRVREAVARWSTFANEAGVPSKQADLIGKTHLL